MHESRQAPTTGVSGAAQALGFSPCRAKLRRMPTVLRVGGMRFAIYPNDHPPAHVHLIGPGWAVVVKLAGPRGPEVREVVGPCSERDARRALDLTREHRAALLEAWRHIHG